MTGTSWPPLVKLLLAVAEREPTSGNDLISYLTQQYRMSTHTYVKARRLSISKGLIQRTPTGEKGRSAQYTLTELGREYLDNLEPLKIGIRGFGNKKYYFKFGEELGQIDFSIKSNLPSPLHIGTLYHEGVLSLLFDHLNKHLWWSGGHFKDETINVEAEINIKISAKGVRSRVADSMRRLYFVEKEEKLEDPHTTVVVDGLIADTPKFQDVLKWYLSNVFGQPQPDLDGKEVKEWW
jgi:DNA-binding MarR family transcriptional regulator